MNELNFLIGSWKTEGEIISDKEPPARITGTDSYEWILEKSFILHKVDVMMGDEKTEAIELIGPGDKSKKTYNLRSFDKHGNFVTMEGRLDENGVLQISGDKMRSRLSLINENHMSAHWEKSEDNKNWSPWMDLQFSK